MAPLWIVTSTFTVLIKRGPPHLGSRQRDCHSQIAGHEPILARLVGLLSAVRVSWPPLGNRRMQIARLLVHGVGATNYSAQLVITRCFGGLCRDLDEIG